jgi:cellulose synthase (UDP-forming)
MRGLRVDPTEAYAPLPASAVRTRISLGTWFQGRPGAMKAVTILALIVGVCYIAFRVLFTSLDTMPFFFWMLLLAEAVGFISFALLAFEAWDISPTPRRPSLDVPVDVVIATYDESVDIVEPTIVGALLMRGDTTIFLSDDSNRPEMKALADQYGIVYQSRRNRKHAKAGNINAILPRLTGDLLLVIDADHVPSPDFLDATTGYFRDPTIALVQTAHSFRNHNSVMHEEQGRHEQSLFFDVLLPGRNRLGSVFWCGSAGLIRRSALLEVGGMATETVTEDFETSLYLQARGHKIVYHNEHLVQGLAPDTLNAYLIQRFRWAQGTLSAFRPGRWLPWRRGLTWKQKVSYTGALLHYLTPVQRLVYAITLIIVGAFGIVPMTYQGLPHLVLWAGWIVLSLLAVTALERGTSHPFEGTRNILLSMGVFLRAIPALVSRRRFAFHVTPKNEIDQGGWPSIFLLWLPFTLGLVTAVVLGFRWVDLLVLENVRFGLLPPISLEILLVISFFAIVEVAILSQIFRDLMTRRQERALWRFPVQLPATVAGEPASVIDLHQTGGGFFAPLSAIDGKEQVPIELETRQIKGTGFICRGTLTIRSVRPVAGQPGLVRVGGVIDWASPRTRRAVIEHCYVLEPYRARNQAWMRSSPRASVHLPGTANGKPVTIVDVSVGGAGFHSSHHEYAEGDIVRLKVSLPNDELITGALTVRNVTERDGGMVRVGGLVTWNQIEWLSAHVDLFVQAQRKTSHAYAFSPLL